MTGTAAFRRHLIHTCTIQRATVSPDPYGDDERAWADEAQGVACRLVVTSADVITDAIAEHAAVTVYLLLLPTGTDIRNDDRVTDVVLEDGSLVMADDGLTPQVFVVEAVRPRRARAVRHVSVELKRVE